MAEKEKETVEKEEKEVKEEKKETKKKNKDDEEFYETKKEKSTFQRVMNVILWIVLIVWMVICLIDFFRVQAKQDPIMCIFGKETTTYTEKDESSATYGEGTVDRWTGLGYRVYRYKRANYDGIEYGPFWIGDRTATVEKK